MKVTLVAYTPDPDKVCSMAARTCTSHSCPMIDSNVGTLRHALASGHESVAEHAAFTFQVEGISRACSHQLVRHRLASYSQQSQRYVNMGGFEYVTPESISRRRDRDSDPYFYLQEYEYLMEAISKLHKGMVDAGIPEEDARYILPNACCTNITITMNARELRHFFEERCCTRAQWEIRELAEKMLDEVKKVAPVLFENVGSKCLRLGYCPEVKGCGRMESKEAKE